MKKIFLAAVLFAGSFAMQAQGLDFGIKAGANFSNFSGDIDTDGITNFHAGAVVELNLVPTFSVQAEGLFSSQGGKYDTVLAGARDIQLDYISVPVMAKFYILPEKLSLMAGPQFSFLVNEAEEAFEAKTFDFAAAGGVELKIIAGLFAQARYTIGITDAFDGQDGFNTDAKNAVFQLSVGYFF